MSESNQFSLAIEQQQQQDANPQGRNAEGSAGDMALEDDHDDHQPMTSPTPLMVFSGGSNNAGASSPTGNGNEDDNNNNSLHPEDAVHARQSSTTVQPRKGGMLLSARTFATNKHHHGGDAKNEESYDSADDEDEDDACGICLENPGKGRMVTLCCCRNTVCMKDAQLVGACPFCREEPLIWDIKE